MKHHRRQEYRTAEQHAADVRAWRSLVLGDTSGPHWSDDVTAPDTDPHQPWPDRGSHWEVDA